jgi:hypothetical protein
MLASSWQMSLAVLLQRSSARPAPAPTSVSGMCAIDKIFTRVRSIQQPSVSILIIQRPLISSADPLRTRPSDGSIEAFGVSVSQDTEARPLPPLGTLPLLSQATVRLEPCRLQDMAAHFQIEPVEYISWRSSSSSGHPLRFPRLYATPPPSPTSFVGRKR